MPRDRSMFENPSPPPGYETPDSEIKYKEPFQMIDGVCCQFLGLIIESGALELTGAIKFEIQTSDEEEIIELPAVEKEPPILIDLDLEEAPPVIKSEPPDTPSATCPEPADISVEKVPRKKTLTKKDTSPRKKTHSAKLKTEKSDDSIESDSDTHSIRSRKKKESPPSKSFKNRKDRSESEDSSYSRRKKVLKKRQRSRSRSHSSDHHSSEEDKKFVKSEYPVKSEYSRNLYGSYYCEACKVSMNSQGTFESHLSGKRHQKALKAKNTAETVSKSIAPTKAESRYPMPPPNVYRMKTREVSLIQAVVEESIKSPCPGLDKVLEIQGIEETFYYCELCDAPCSTNTILPHLKGHKHQLRCLKLFRPEIYESYRFKKKHEIEAKVIRILKDVEKEVGCGRITVEKDFRGKPEPGTFGAPLSTKNKPTFDGGSWRRREDMPGPSHLDPEDAFPEFYPTTTIPDTSKSDFYCPICDSHMNSLNMWESHIRGKRHITNTKKAPGEAPSKTKSVVVPGARAQLMTILEDVEGPVVGLSEMRETQNPEIGANQYNCFLCGACVTTLDVVEHILSQKHRTKYLEKIKHPDMETLQSLNIQESRLYSIIEETCAKVEAKSGRGYLEVHVMRNAVSRR